MPFCIKSLQRFGELENNAYLCPMKLTLHEDTMKKHFYLLGFLITGALSFVACGGGDDAPQNPVPSPITVGYELPAPKGGNSIIITHYGTLNDKSGQTGANYTIEWDTEKGAQRWSAYKLCKSLTVKNVNRYYASNDGSLSSSCQYPNDPDLPSTYRFTAGDDPYKYSGYDHGHICPSADRLSSTESNYQTFYITNMQPQFGKKNNVPGFNDCVWANMENQVRNWASRYDTLYVCKGGTIDKNDDIIEYVYQNSHQKERVNNKYIPVPRFFFMAILGRKGNTFKATGFWINQETYDSRYSSNTPKNYAISISELQKKTGIDFFYSLPDNIENQVETSSPYDGWY